MIRISNPSKGVSTSWIDMDTTYNNQSGASGLHAWIRLKANLQPGETITVIEPDANRQPEGLARILHPSFMVSPADQIRIEFKHKDEGIALACLAIDDPDPVISAKSGAGWATYENYKVEFPHLIFTRADDPEQPFYLSSGSLSFRQQHTQLELSAELQSQYFLDPRKNIISQDKEYLDASGSLVSGRDLLDISVLNDRTSQSPAQNLQAWHALVSWPDAPSVQLMQLTDLLDWENAFCLGSRGAVAINSILDNIWPLRQDVLLHRETLDGHRLQFARSVHINTNQPDIWKSLLGSSPGPGKAATMALYPSPVTDADYFVMDDFSLTGMASRLANLSLANPVFSISDFFNRGRLSDAMASEGNDSLHRLLQLRGFNGNSFRLMPSGTAFILHLMCTAEHNGMERSISARMWMLRVPKPGNEGNLEIIHIEWTDPGHHLASLN